MEFNFKKSAVLVGLAMLISYPTQAASLRDMADEIYGSFTTSGGPDNFRTNNGDHVYTGGAYSLRFNTDDIRLVNFQPPSTSASCSGIDFYAGSIQFASKDQFIQAGRNIAAAATVYAFRLALNSVCASCNSIMQNIQAWIQRINDLANVTCQDSLEMMENLYSSENGINNSAGWEAAYTNTDGWADPTKFIGKETAANYLEEWARDNVDFFADIGSKDPVALSSMGDLAYLVAHNSNLPQYLFPFYANTGDMDLARAATWSVIAGAAKPCPNMNEQEPDGSMCGVGAKYRHNYASFIRGNQKGDKTKALELEVPKCDKVENVNLVTVPGVTLKQCDFTQGSNGVVQKYGTADSLQPQILKDVFGEDAVNSTTGVFDLTKVCTSKNLITNVDSYFAKQLRFSGSGSTSLSQSELYIASILGTQYSRDLYRMNSKGEVITNLNESADCGALAEIVKAKVDNLVDNLILEAQKNLLIAEEELSQSPIWKDNWSQVSKLLDKVRASLSEQIKIDKAAKANTLNISEES
ncbi:conjugal transfer protein TraH [Vibrio sp. Makdt]|uniref:conjugal transfer protein TraH n=1 Tax=Vibrio sp. Makdt TaxID=2998828 RepID=UPI0022CD55B2|nr:conjugal transfer protein TraH [Vibrio sp. Makdt]MDA0152480.1 conjugal transfer protein TraH [Vibrio sp. Makdt]